MAVTPLTPTQLNAYFDRLQLTNLRNPVKADLQHLCKMHLAHVQQIPYENLSLHLDKAKQQFPRVSLQTNDLFRKIVQCNRGGYCFEQNILFAAALRACGFSIYLLSARTNRVRPNDPRTTLVIHNQPHIAIGVIIGGTHWHADVGYGGKGLRLPIKNTLLQITDNGQVPTVCLSANSSYTDSTLSEQIYGDVHDTWIEANSNCPGYGHRLRTKKTHEDVTDSSTIQMPGLFVQALDSKGQFQDLYSFHVQDTNLAEYEMLNWYTSTCPAANHLKNIVVAQQTADGRHTFDGIEFKVFKNTQLAWSKRPESDEDIYHHLQRLFKLTFR